MGMFSVICENKEKYQNFLLKIFNFYNLGKICISHGHVFVICENKEKYQNFLLKMFNFYNLGKICISHGHVFVICENKDADQPCSNCKADQRLYFRGFTCNKVYFKARFQASSPLWLFSMVYVGLRPDCWFSHTKAHMVSYFTRYFYTYRLLVSRMLSYIFLGCDCR